MKSKTAIVTGASSGIGEATAERFAEAGYRVFGTSRRAASAGQRSFEMLTLDVTSDQSVEAAVREVVRRAGRIDVLVNNAGFGVAPAGAEESSIEQAQSIFDTNFFGVVRMTRAVVPEMRQQGAGRIINIGSVLGFLPMPYGALYAATKHAVEGYSESLDHELRTTGHPRVGHRARVHEDAVRRELPGTRCHARGISRGSCGGEQAGEGSDGNCRTAPRRGRRRTESGQRGAPEGPIHGRWSRGPPAIPSHDICPPA